MKTLTEVSGSVIRVAAAAIAEARRSLPSDEKPAAPPVPEAPAQGAAAGAGEEPARTAESAEAPAATGDAPAETPASVEAPATNDALDAAVAKATGLSGDRLTMVRGAVEAAGRRTADVRLVRVFGLEEPVTGATKVGAYQYVVDLFPASMKQVSAPAGEDRGRRKGGRGGGRGGGDRGAKGGAVGGFSMDSLRDDRKNERGGRGGPGGGRRSGGGRGGPGGPPGGAPKK